MTVWRSCLRCRSVIYTYHTQSCFSCPASVGICLGQLGCCNEIPLTRGLKHRHFFLTGRKTGSLRSRLQLSYFLVRTPFLACSWQILSLSLFFFFFKNVFIYLAVSVLVATFGIFTVLCGSSIVMHRLSSCGSQA